LVRALGLTLDFTLVIALAGTPETILKKVMGLQLAEHPGALARAVAQDPGHRQGGVVVKDRERRTAEKVEGRNVAIAKRLAGLRRIGLQKSLDS
jgi:hypothetical protein